MKYITKQGDTWDSLGVQIYGSSIGASYLIVANSDLSEWLDLPIGSVLDVPKAPKTLAPSTLPPWLRDE